MFWQIFAAEPAVAGNGIRNYYSCTVCQKKHCKSKHFTRKTLQIKKFTKKHCTLKHVQYLQNCTALSFLHDGDELDTATFECTLIFNLSLIFWTPLQYCFTVLQYVVGLQSRLEQRCVVVSITWVTFPAWYFHRSKYCLGYFPTVVLPQ